MTRRDPLLSELQDKAAAKKERMQKISAQTHGKDGNCGYRVLAVCLGRNGNEWPEKIYNDGLVCGSRDCGTERLLWF
ncbi:11282_t:CDS:2 [Ambispora gerdemannii]|uniref:11282_t:CDS:1 n=1 Tax=Ambispora gerdemannii TaxID=144530 RepID=A0A9N8WD11_9GLOM|nr:11282_t:CDS:2 [Ambispora gerdemannii]